MDVSGIIKGIIPRVFVLLVCVRVRAYKRVLILACVCVTPTGLQLLNVTKKTLLPLLGLSKTSHVLIATLCDSIFCIFDIF